MDRFSFIVLDLSLHAIIEDRSLHKRFREGGETIIFKANDFVDPDNSEVIRILKTMPQLKEQAVWFSAICLADINSVPTLKEFLAGHNIPQQKSRDDKQLRVTQKSIRYISAFPVVDALNFVAAEKHVGDRIELIGKIVEVKNGVGRYGRGRSRKYIFINFGDWRGKIVKISIWSDSIGRLNNKPSDDWIGRWVSVTGLLDPPFHSRRWGYTHLSISVHDDSQIQALNEREALFRLGKLPSPASVAQPQDRQKVGTSGSVSPGAKAAAATATSSPNNAPPTGTQPSQSPRNPAGAVQSRTAGSSAPSKNRAIVDQFRRSVSSGATPPSPLTPAQPTSALPPPSTHSSSVTPRPSVFVFIRKMPWWIWVGIGLALLLLVGQRNSQRVDERPTAMPTKYTSVVPANQPKPPSPSIVGTIQMPSPGSAQPRPWPISASGVVPDGSGTAVIAQAPAEREHVPGTSSLGPTSGIPPLPEPAPTDFSLTKPAPPAAIPSGTELVVAAPALPPPIKVDPALGSIPLETTAPVQDERRGRIDIRRADDAMRVQMRLVELGFLVGAADGIWGQRSRGALTAFRIANRLGQDDAWDEMTETKLFSGTITYGERVDAAGFVGGWAANLGDCHTGAAGRPPLILTLKKAETSGGICEFGSVQRDADGWRVQAICTVGAKSWSANIRFIRSGNRLTWSSEKGTDVYVRCSGS
jgi:hypothetical protein